MTAHTSPANMTSMGNVHPKTLFTSSTDAPSWGVRPFALLALGACAWLLHTAIGADGSWIWAIALLIAGMPHGGYDLAALHRISRNTRQTATRFILYSLVMGACIGAFLALPTITTIAFLILAAHHFGISDSVWTRGRIPTLRGHLIGLAHGVAILSAPFALNPTDAWAPFAKITSLLPHVTSISATTLQPIAIAFLALALIALLGASIFAPRSRAQLIEQWSVVGAMLALSATIPALAAVGVYFIIVHASGHCLRANVPDQPVQPVSLANFIRVHRDSLPLLIPSIAIVFAGALLFAPPLLEALALSFILFCIIATLPHHLLWLGWFNTSDARGVPPRITHALAPLPYTK